MDKVSKRLPVVFQKLTEYDSRFMRVKIWLMHLSENYNGSYFSQEAVEKAIPSLANTPIVGYLEGNGDSEDFSDHRMVVVRTSDGEIKTKYLGQAYGMIPENNNAKFEDRVGDDGVSRTYLTVEGLLWTKWDESIAVMSRDLDKSQSMELHDDYEGHWDSSTGLFHFTNFKFFGACILGNGVMPAMNKASVEVEFSANFEDHVQNMMEEFKLVYSRYQTSIEDDINKKEEGEVMKEKLLELLAKFSLTEEVLQEKGFNIEEYSTEEELEAKVASIAEEVSLNHTATCDKCNQESCVCTNEPKVYSAEEYDALQANYDQLKAEFDTTVSAKEALDGQLLEVSEKLSAFEALEQEVNELREFKINKLAVERQAEEDALFEQFSEQLTDEELAPVKEKASQMAVEDIEKELFALVGKKTAVFSKKNPAVKVVVVKDENKDVNDYTHLLEKHSK